MQEIIIFSDSSRGVYIPQHFAESIKRDCVSGISPVQFAILRHGPEDEFYWEVWDEVLANARVHYNGKEYLLFQDGDLFLISEDEIDSWLEA